MLAASPHRGDQTVVRSLGACTIGISDLDGRNEATLAGDATLAVAFAGALDNAEELAARFGLDSNRTVSPADVVLATFRAMGAQAPLFLRGTYGCVVTDGTRLWAFRDHVGLETLFYRKEAEAGTRGS